MQNEAEYWSEEEYWSENEPTAQLDFENMAIEDDGPMVEVSAGDILLPKQRPLPSDSKAAVVPPPTLEMAERMSALYVQGWINGHPFKRISLMEGQLLMSCQSQAWQKLGGVGSIWYPLRQRSRASLETRVYQ